MPAKPACSNSPQVKCSHCAHAKVRGKTWRCVNPPTDGVHRGMPRKREGPLYDAKRKGFCFSGLLYKPHECENYEGMD